MIREVQIIYRLQGINISDKYIEVIIRQLTSKLKIVNPGDSKYFIGSPININTLKNQNTMLLNKNKKPIFAVYQIFGLEDVPGKSDSFLSAASFQDTKKILTSAAVKGQVDELIGIKENVILGHLVPIGTGLEVIDESPDAVKHKAYLFDY
jgi:DNA-directed RNA polymerase subunit beta'